MIRASAVRVSIALSKNAVNRSRKLKADEPAIGKKNIYIKML